MTVRLRPHHLLCLLTYGGKGYSPAFTAGFNRIAERIARGEEIEIVEGPDDVCAPLLHEAEPHCLRPSVTERDRAAAAEASALLDQPVLPLQRVTLDAQKIGRMRDAFKTGEIRTACSGCEWHGLCSSLADNGYVGTLLPRGTEG